MGVTKVKGIDVRDGSITEADIVLSLTETTLDVSDEFVVKDSTSGLLKRATVSVVETYLNTKYQAKSSDLAAIAAIAGTTGLLKKTAAGAWSLDTSTYLTAVTKAQVESVLTGAISTHTHSYQPVGTYFESNKGTLALANLDVFVDRTSGTYSVTGTGFTNMLAVLKASGSVSSIEFYSDYSGVMKYRNSIDSNRYSPWYNFWHDGNFTPANYSLTSHTHSYLSLTGGTLTGGGIIDPYGSITVQQTATGGNATGFFWKNMADTANISGIGCLTSDGAFSSVYMGWGINPWDSSTNFCVNSSAAYYKGNIVYHAGNFVAGTNYASASQVHYVGTTSIAANRASAAQTLTGVSIDGNSASVGNKAISNILASKDQLVSNSNLNLVYEIGTYLNTTGNGTGNSNWPDAYGILNVFGYNNTQTYGNFQQHFSPDGTQRNRMLFTSTPGAWGAWRTVWDSGNFTPSSYALSSSIGNGTLTLAVSGSGLTGSQTFSANQAGNAVFTVTSNATTATTGSTIVLRTSAGYVNSTYFNASCATEDAMSTSSYIYESGSDGYFRKKSLPVVKSEIVTKAAIEAALTGGLVVEGGGVFGSPSGTRINLALGGSIGLLSSIANDNLILGGKGTGSVFFNYGNGCTGGVRFYNGGTSQIAHIDSAGSILANSFVRSGGTSAQILMADGSVTNVHSHPYLPLAGGTMDNANLVANLNSQYFGGQSLKQNQWFNSLRDFTLGTLIQTSIDYSVTGSDAWLLEIKGNSYTSFLPFDITVQGYMYNNAMISMSGISNGEQITGIVLFNYGGKLCFWFPTQGYWQGFSVFVSTVTATGYKTNAITSITNEAKPTVISKEYSVSSTVKQSYHSGNLNLSTIPFIASTVSANTFTSSVATGTAPFTVSSTTLVSNLNATYLNGKSESDFIVYGPNYQDINFALTATRSNWGWTNTGLPYGWAFVNYITFGVNTDLYKGQIAIKYDTSELAFRSINQGVANAWRKVWHDGNFISGTDYAPAFSTLAVNKGGTGLTSIGTATQWLRVNNAGTALEWATASTVPYTAQLGAIFHSGLYGYAPTWATGATIDTLQRIVAPEGVITRNLYLQSPSNTGGWAVTTDASGVLKYNNVSSITRLSLDQSGNIALGGLTTLNRLAIAYDLAPPSSSGASGTAGEIVISTNYLYVCINTNSWKRVSLSTF